MAGIVGADNRFGRDFDNPTQTCKAMSHLFTTSASDSEAEPCSCLVPPSWLAVLFFAIFIIIQIIGLPEAPRWLVAQDRHEEGREVISAVLDKPLDDESVTRAPLDIQSGLEEEK